MIRCDNDKKRLLKGFFVTAVASMMLYACANPGTPSGGPIDVTPPRVVGSTPRAFAVNNTKTKIIINFDEYIKLDKPNEKVVISPPQLQQPEIKTSGKKIVVNLLDSLKKNSTYTIDFSDAIQDNNEGNPLGNYAFTFSSGASIDTMEVSGTVLNASNLEPVKGTLVGLHSNLNDSAFVKLPFDRVARTDSKGHFCIRGIAPGKYRIFALTDGDQNFCFSQKSEDLAFNDSLVIPSFDHRVRQDTAWIDSLTYDTIVPKKYTHYLPDNLMLRLFKEAKTQQSLVKKERLVPQKFSLYFTAPNKELPKMKGLNFDERNAFVVETDAKKDTIHYWVRDSVNYKKDTLSLALTYNYTDSLNRLLSRTDTLNLVAKQKTLRKEVEQKKKKKKKNEPEVVQTLSVDKHIPQQMDVYDYIYFTFEEPLRSFDKRAIHLKEKVDSLYKDIPFDFHQDSVHVRQYNLVCNWSPEKEYSLEIDSTAFVGQYGLVSAKIKESIKVRSLNDYGDIYFNVTGACPTAYVELLDGSDKVIRKMPVRNGRASFYFLAAGKYCARLINDVNANGVWDTGLYDKKIQPEEVFYYPEVINLKVLWKIDKTWNVRALPLDRQKPADLKKQKPDDDKKKNGKNQNGGNQNNRRNS